MKNKPQYLIVVTFGIAQTQNKEKQTQIVKLILCFVTSVLLYKKVAMRIMRHI